ncbi:MAG: phage tail protein [Methanoregula sp.]|nr:phage tail protein [Methanoregula sp.]
MEGDRIDPYRQFRFRIEIDGIIRAGFQEIRSSETTIDPVEYHEGNEHLIFRKLSGLTKYGDITLKWGITDSMEFYTWCKNVIDSGAAPAKKNMSIILTDESGVDTARWDIVHAWPTKCTSPTLNAQGNEGTIEALEIVYERFTRVK